MFALLYEDAFEANPELADAVWDYWDARLIPDEEAAIAWMQIAMSAFTNTGRSEAVS